jgi:hypothetical protein
MQELTTALAPIQADLTNIETILQDMVTKVDSALKLRIDHHLVDGQVLFQ